MAWRAVIQGLPDEHNNGISMAEKARAIGVINTMADEQRAQRIIAGLQYPNATPEELIATVQLLLGATAASVASGAGATASTGELGQDTQGLLQALLAATTSGMEALHNEIKKLRVKSDRSFSEVGDSEAMDCLESLGIDELDGQESDPLPTVPAGSTFTVFPMHKYRDEKEATEPFVEWVKQELLKAGITVGKDGVTVKDLRARSPMFTLQVPVGDDHRTYSGGTDVGIMAWGTSVDDCKDQLLILIELKFKQPSGFNRGQARMELLGASGVGQHPLLQVLTAGDTCTLMMLRGAHLVNWVGVPWGQMVLKMAEHIRGSVLSPHFKRLAPDGTFVPSAVPTEEQELPELQALKRLRPFVPAQLGCLEGEVLPRFGMAGMRAQHNANTAAWLMSSASQMYS